MKKDGSFKFGEYNADTNNVESYFGVRTHDGHTPFAHDMMFTKNWFVIIDSSVHFNMTQLMNETGNFFMWNPNANLKLGLAPRHVPNVTSDDVIWFDFGKPHVILHPLNSWEEEDDGTVVMWSPCGDDFDIGIETGGNSYYMTEFRINPRKEIAR